jgi:hypothetical protein
MKTRVAALASATNEERRTKRSRYTEEQID